jgi:hypothetical protein
MPEPAHDRYLELAAKERGRELPSVARFTMGQSIRNRSEQWVTLDASIYIIAG